MHINSLTQIREITLTKVSECNANSTTIECKPVWKEDVSIDGKLISFKVDTGSDVTVLPKRLIEQLAPGCSLNQSKTLLRAFGGNVVRPIGTCTQSGFLNGKKRNIEIEIVDFDSVPLLGLNACIDFGLIDKSKITFRRVNFL